MRRLLVTADDFGIGPETSRGILDLAEVGAVTSTVLLVNSPFAENAVAQWRRRGEPVELGWHPCLTLDRPVLPPGRVPSLVDADGRFPTLRRFLTRLVFGWVNTSEVRAELRAQLERFVQLVGAPPTNVNAHHHLHVFRPVGDALQDVLRDVEPRPYLRQVAEPWRTLVHVSGARVKRLALSWFGTTLPPAPASLVGITNPPRGDDPDFFARWLRHVPGPFVELTCHPGHLDATLCGRDPHINGRPHELRLLADPAFRAAVADAGFVPYPAAFRPPMTEVVGVPVP